MGAWHFCKDSISKASDENVKRALERSVWKHSFGCWEPHICNAIGPLMLEVVSNQEALHETQGIYSNIVGSLMV